MKESRKAKKKKKDKKSKKSQRKMEAQVKRDNSYEEAEISSKILTNLSELSRMQRILSVDSSSQKRILTLLQEAGGSSTQRDLTVELRIKPGSASEIISKLEGAGLLQRSQNEADRRVVDITLTEAGKEAAKEAQKEQDVTLEKYFEGLKEDEKITLLSLLDKVNADWSAQCHALEKGRRNKVEVVRKKKLRNS